MSSRQLCSGWQRRPRTGAWRTITSHPSFFWMKLPQAGHCLAIRCISSLVAASGSPVAYVPTAGPVDMDAEAAKVLGASLVGKTELTAVKLDEDLEDDEVSAPAHSRHPRRDTPH